MTFDHSELNLQQGFSLSSGGGAIGGAGAAVRANPADGSVSYAFSLPLPKARALTPELALTYNSGAGMSEFGLGWSIGLARIDRRTSRHLPNYNEAESVFSLVGNDDLVPQLDVDGTRWTRMALERGKQYKVSRFRQRNEASFTRLEYWRELASGESHWRSWSTDNVVSFFGAKRDARAFDPRDPTRIFSWYIERQCDAFGNVVLFEYKHDSSDDPPVSQLQARSEYLRRWSTPYLKHIRYGNRTPFDGTPPGSGDFCYTLLFDYGEHAEDDIQLEETQPWPDRPDPFSRYDAGFERRWLRRCERIVSFHNFPELRENALEPVNALEIGYQTETNGLSLVKKIRSVGFQRDQSGILQSDPSPWSEFQYQSLDWSDHVKTVNASSGIPLDIDTQVSGRKWQDLFSDGLPGLIHESGGAIHFQRNEGSGALGPAKALEPQSSLQGLDSALAVEDVGGVGRKAFVLRQEGIAGYARLGKGGTSLDPFRSFPHQPTIGINDANMRLVDLDGDGQADLLYTDGDFLYWSASRGEDGFGAARRLNIPIERAGQSAFVIGDRTGQMFLADMSGDGLTDVVRIENGRVRYWPNLGQGAFGMPVDMANAPRFDHPEQFDPERIRLADIDGSGVSDILYLSGSGVRVWLNQSGNGWAEQAEIPRAFPPQTPMTAIQVTDITGSGTACLVWSDNSGAGSPGGNLRYLELTGGVKPYLLSAVLNGHGGETRLTFAPSTKFYLDDMRAGRPWLTRIGYPVHCLAAEEKIDHVTGLRFTSHYSYHHGAYDPVHREFCGFARVDQTDTEVIDQDGSSARPFFQPPVQTRTWFHTGLSVDLKPLETTLRKEFYTHPALANQSGTVDFPEHLPTRDWHQAFRAMRGAILRSEVYALDDTPEMEAPYSISMRQWRLECRQRSAGSGNNDIGDWAVFQRLEAGEVTIILDRKPTDPRMSQSMVLEWDSFGNPLRDATINYARKTFPAGLPSDVVDAQAKTYVTLTERQQTEANLEDDTVVPASLWKKAYCRHLPREVSQSQFELHRLTLSATVEPIRLAEILSGLPDVDYTQNAQHDPCRRLVASSRIIYLADDLTGPLPLGQSGRLGLVHHSETLAMSEAMMQRYFDGSVDQQTMRDAGYLVAPDPLRLEATAYWATSGTAIFPADAEDKFYLPVGQRDPFEAETLIEYDDHLLLPRRMIDAAGLETLVVHDYRVLAPQMIRDPNHNWAAVRHDIRGRVSASAIMGKTIAPMPDRPTGNEPCDGDTLDHPSQVFQYDDHRWQREGKPCRAMTKSFETHHDPDAPDALRKTLVSYEYSDGFGNLVMTKAQAAPGPASIIGPEGDLQEVDTAQHVPPALRWIGNGRTVYNNKGQALRQFEPYFSTSPEYEDHPALVEQGASGIAFYDAAGRSVGGLASDGTWSKQRISPWMSENWDGADTCLIDDLEADETLGAHFAGLPPEMYQPRWLVARASGELGAQAMAAAEKSAAHSGTPSIGHTDTLGRIIRSEAYPTADNPQITTTSLDIEGNMLSVKDARGNTVISYSYSMLPPPDDDTPKPPLREESMDRGVSMALPDVLGRPFLSWDARGHRIRTSHDLAGRVVATWLKVPDSAEICIGAVEYGEAAPDAVSRNLRGTVWCSWDQSGLSETLVNDFKGNTLSAAQRFLRPELTQPVDLQDSAARDAFFEAETFVAVTDYDALNRPTRSEAPRSSGMEASVTLPEYDEGGGLARVSVSVPGRDLGVMVQNIIYDAKGQRQSVQFGNGTRTEYAYDPRSYRLTRLHTTHMAEDRVYQDLRYTYDAVGNITHIRDNAHQDVYFDNAVVGPEQSFTYDALYRLVRAEGREHAEQAGIADWRNGWEGRAHPQDGHRMRRYTQRYDYDGVGNITRIRHTIGGDSSAGWTRLFDYDSGSNRLLATTLGSALPEVFSYNAHGSMTRMDHLQALDWNHAEQLVRVDKGPGGVAHYSYAGGERVRKRLVGPDGRVRERIYFGGFEIYRERSADGTVMLERETLHVSDDAGRIALVETQTVDSAGRIDAPAPLPRYQLGNHLGSAALELDGVGGVISYEEYHPYGTTAYFAVDTARDVPPKRYRYTGKERDEETGFSYHSARYYAPWLGRWTAVDPIGIGDGVNVYAYVGGRPVGSVDPGGMCDLEVCNTSLSFTKPENHDAGQPSVRAQTRWEELDSKYNPLTRLRSEILLEAHSDPEGRIAKFGVDRMFALRASYPHVQQEYEKYLIMLTRELPEDYKLHVYLLGVDTGWTTTDVIDFFKQFIPSANAGYFERYGHSVESQRYANVSKNQPPYYQAHHLMQNAAFNQWIPRSEGVAVSLNGAAFGRQGIISPETAMNDHAILHRGAERFWDRYRYNTDLPHPTVREYNLMVMRTLTETSLPKSEQGRLIHLMVAQQVQHGVYGYFVFDRIPRRTNVLSPTRVYFPGPYTENNNLQYSPPVPSPVYFSRPRVHRNPVRLLQR